MAHFNKNLLEAFRDAGEDPMQRPAGATGAAADEESGGAGGPFARAEPRLEETERTGLPPFLLLLSGVALFSLGVVAGRMSMVGAEAAEPGRAGEQDAVVSRPLEPWFERTPAGAAPERTAAPRTSAADPREAAAPPPALPLYDPANRFTAIAIQYDNTPEGQALARATAGFLQTQGFESAVPYEHKSNVFVFVGASGKLDAVQRIVENLQGTLGPTGKKDFRTAYAVNIDDYIKR